MTAPSAYLQKIVIVGGGTAGWLSAGLLAARRQPNGQPYFQVTVIEPPNLPPIGVGEGTWPSMRSTLKAIGVQEADFVRACNASFKQGSKFVNWSRNAGEYYYHPFEMPLKVPNRSTPDVWHQSGSKTSFARFANRQEYICEQHLAPKLSTSPDYAGVLNYGYHFDSYAMAKFLRQHCEQRLGVRTIPDLMVGVTARENGDISGIQTKDHDTISGDFFVDCTGFRGLLLKQYFGAKTIPLGHVLPANRAVTLQRPYSSDTPIRSTTIATAQTAGWIWDVSLATRRGTGYVYSSEHISTDEAASTLLAYLGISGTGNEAASVRELKFTAEHLDKFWIRNCAAIGLSAGFIEPLEASSIMLTEISARTLSNALVNQSTDRADIIRDYNTKIRSHWNEIVDFLKLHYVLNERDERFWVDVKDPITMPETLKERLEIYRREGFGPTRNTNAYPLFPTESYQYIWYGILGRQHGANLSTSPGTDFAKARETIKSYHAKADRLTAILPTNKALLAGQRDKTVSQPA